MILSAARQRVREKRVLAGQKPGSQLLIDPLLNEGASQFCLATWCRQSTPAGTNVVDGTAAYTLDSSILHVFRARHDGDGLILTSRAELDREYLDWQTIKGRPTHYFMTSARTIRLFPIPDTSVTAGLVADAAIAWTNVSADADDFLTNGLPLDAEWAPVHFALWQMGVNPDDHKGEWERLVADQLAAVAAEFQEGQPAFVPYRHV